MQVNIYEAKTRLSELGEAVHAGQTIVINKAGTPMAKRVPLDHVSAPEIRFGLMEGEFVEPDDFDGPLPDGLQAAFEGRSLP